MNHNQKITDTREWLSSLCEDNDDEARAKDRAGYWDGGKLVKKSAIKKAKIAREEAKQKHRKEAAGLEAARKKRRAKLVASNKAKKTKPTTIKADDWKIQGMGKGGAPMSKKEKDRYNQLNPGNPWKPRKFIDLKDEEDKK